MNEQQMWACVCVNLLMNVDAVAFRHTYMFIIDPKKVLSETQLKSHVKL